MFSTRTLVALPPRGLARGAAVLGVVCRWTDTVPLVSKTGLPLCCATCHTTCGLPNRQEGQMGTAIVGRPRKQDRRSVHMQKNKAKAPADISSIKRSPTTEARVHRGTKKHDMQYTHRRADCKLRRCGGGEGDVARVAARGGAGRSKCRGKGGWPSDKVRRQRRGQHTTRWGGTWGRQSPL